MKYWLVKSEPNVFSIDDLAACPDQTRWWKHVRNYQARNFMRDEMHPGDRVFFYHSNTDVPAIVGIARVIREGYPDYTAWDPKSEHFDPRSSLENPIWYMVDVQYMAALNPPVTRNDLKEHPVLGKMGVMKKGNRLSVMPVEANEWQAVLALRNMADPLNP